MRNIKVCMVALEHKIDDVRVYHREALSLHQYGFNVSIIGLDSRSRIKLRHIKLKQHNKLKNIVTALVCSFRENAQIYHVHDLTALIVGLVIKILKPRAKIIWDVHEYYPDVISMAKSLKRKIWLIITYNLLERLFTKFCDAIIVTDEAIEKLYRNVKKPIIVLHNYVKLEYFRKFISHTISPTLRNIHLIYVGGISEYRGLDFIVKLANYFSNDSNIHITITLVGPILESNAEKYLDILKKVKNIKYLGIIPHEEVPIQITKSHIGLILFKELPKYQKNILTKLFEYAALGKPIISTFLKPVCRYIISNGWGLCIKYGSVEDFKSALINILSNYNYYRNNCLRSIKKYSWEIEHIKLIRLYKYMIKQII